MIVIYTLSRKDTYTICFFVSIFISVFITLVRE